MKALSEIIGSPLLVLSDCSMPGRIEDVFFDGKCKKIVYFCVAPEGASESYYVEEAKKLVAIERVSAIGDALVVDGADALEFCYDVDCTTLSSQMLKKPVYTASGAFKGELNDVLCDDKGKVLKLLIGDKVYSSAELEKVGAAVIVRGGTIKKTRKRVMPVPAEDRKVTILTEDPKADSVSKRKTKGDTPKQTPIIPDGETVKSAEKAEQTVANDLNSKTPAPIAASKEDAQFHAAENIVESETEAAQSASEPSDIKQAEIYKDTQNAAAVLSYAELSDELEANSSPVNTGSLHNPDRIICEYDFLLGRTLSSDLCTYSGELLYPAGSVITDDTVHEARRCGKLIELTLISERRA